MKEALIQQIKLILEEKIIQAKSNFNLLRESLVSDSKSSAGDKHETARAMVQIEMEQAGKQVNDVESLKHLFDKINFNPSKSITMGSLVETQNNFFFITIPLAKLESEGKDVFCIGNQAPLAKVLLGKQVGDSVSFMNQNHIIQAIY